MKFKIQPWRHQLEALERSKDLPGFALFFEMGAGKTGTLINILRHKYNSERRVFPTLILCPPIVIQNWKDEFAKHSNLEPDQITLLTGSEKRRCALFEKGGPIFITNYEALLMSDLYALFQNAGIESLVLDESHKCKAPDAKRTKLAAKLANGEKSKSGEWLHYPIKYRYLLSGSPILNSPMDLFSQFKILDGGETFGSNFFAFRATYFRDKNAGMPKARYFPDWQLKPGALDAIGEKISPISMRVEKKDCLDLPPLVRQTIKVGMTPEQARAYAEMKKDFVAFVENKQGNPEEVVATMALTKALRLMQITAGFAKTVQGSEVTFQKTPKQEALRELLEELTPHSKVIIWAVWRENYEQIRRICEEFQLSYVELTGDQPTTSRFQSVERFNNDPTCRVCLGHPGAGGIGVNLTSAKYSIFYSRTFSLEHSLQAEARNHRGGSEIHDKITRIDLICENTIDELVNSALDQKLEMSHKVLRSELLLELKKQAN